MTAAQPLGSALTITCSKCGGSGVFGTTGHRCYCCNGYGALWRERIIWRRDVWAPNRDAAMVSPEQRARDVYDAQRDLDELEAKEARAASMSAEADALTTAVNSPPREAEHPSEGTIVHSVANRMRKFISVPRRNAEVIAAWLEDLDLYIKSMGLR